MRNKIFPNNTDYLIPWRDVSTDIHVVLLLILGLCCWVVIPCDIVVREIIYYIKQRYYQGNIYHQIISYTTHTSHHQTPDT